MQQTSIQALDVYALARTAGRIDGQLPLERMPRLAPTLATGDGHVDFSFCAHLDRQGRPAAKLLIRGRLGLNCDRCGFPVEVDIDETATFYFVPDARTLETTPIEDVDEEPLLGSERFDLGNLIEDQAILALPMTPRHAWCKTLETGDADTADARRKPFAALAGLKRRAS